MKRHIIAASLSFVVAATAAAAHSIFVLTPSADFGELTPEAGPAIASVNVVVHSDSAWRIAVLRDASMRQRAVRAAAPMVPAANDVLIRSEDGTWMPLLPGIAAPVASGVASDDPAGALHAIDFQMTPTMDMPPGARQIGLHLLLNGQQSADLLLSYSIAPAMTVAADDRDFRIVTSDPSQNRSYEFAPRVCIVRSNVAWALEIYVTDPAKAPGETASLSTDALRVAGPDGRTLPLIAGGPAVPVAAGPPTGRAGVPVQVHLAVVAGGSASEGAYKTQLEFRFSRTDSADR